MALKVLQSKKSAHTNEQVLHFVAGTVFVNTTILFSLSDIFALKATPIWGFNR